MSTLLTLYFVLLGVLALLGLHRLLLTAAAAAARRRPAGPAADLPADAPRVAVQLPLYNEAFVVERLLSAAGRLRYPAGRLEIQVLDDSTDETRRIVDRVARSLAAAGVPIRVIRRPDRAGFKAGALAHGLRHTDAELVAVFDADFLPEPDFLERTVPRLQGEPGLGLVQARWGHANRNASWLTRAQAVFLDGHFAVEHRARAALGHFFNFNGTAGVWRRAAIEDAGGWRADTITEDLDLSYRAQLAGWRFGYEDGVVAPAELPERWTAFRSQQARWVRGSVQTARLLLLRVLAADLPIRIRLDALVHLTNNFAYLFMAGLAALLPACVILRDRMGWRVPGGQPLLSALDLSMLTAGTFAMLVFYGAAQCWTTRRLRPLELFFALCVGAGMSFANAREVLRGLFTQRAVFVRTPKRGDACAQRAATTYRSAAHSSVVLVELVFLAYFAAAVAYAVRWSLWGALPFLALYTVGFAATALGTLKDALASRWSPALDRTSDVPS